MKKSKEPIEKSHIELKTVNFTTPTKGVTISVRKEHKELLDQIFVTPFPDSSLN